MSKLRFVTGIAISVSLLIMYSTRGYAQTSSHATNGSTTEAFRTPEMLAKKEAAEQLEFQAYKLRETGDTKASSEVFQQILEQYHEPLRSALPLTEIMMDQGNYIGAVKLYRNMIPYNPQGVWKGASSSRWNSIDTVMRFVFALSITGNKGEAWDVFQANAKRIPEELQPLFSAHAEGLQDREHYNDITLRAIALTVYAYTYPGKTVMPNQNQVLLADKTPDAIAAYKLASKISPRFAPAHYYLATKLKENGDLAGAKQEWAEAKKYAREPELQSLIRKDDYLYMKQ